MKKKNMKNHIRMRFSTLLLCCLAFVLCAAPAVNADVVLVPAGQIWDIDYPVTGTLKIDGTANLLTNASVSQYIYVQDGGTLYMHSGTIGQGCFIIVCSGAAGMTVYGTDFAVSNGTIEPDGSWTPDSYLGRGILTGCYEDESSIYLWIFSNTAINLQVLDDEVEIDIDIDIKPDSELNKINLKSKGVIPVAVLTTDDFNASEVDPESVTFAGAEPVRSTLEDVDEDGDLDMLFHFKTQELNLDENITKAAEATEATETTLTLTGKRTDVKIRGTDTVRIVSPKKKK